MRSRTGKHRLLVGIQELGKRTLLHIFIGTRIDAPKGAMAAERLEAVVPDLLAIAGAAVHDRPHALADLGLSGGQRGGPRLLGPPDGIYRNRSPSGREGRRPCGHYSQR